MDNKYDNIQYEVIRFNDGQAVVLGEPGCDKTNIQALRVLMAHQIYGIAYCDMLCLTVTTHAQCEIRNRVKLVAGHVMDELLISNFQCYCLKFLTDNNLIPAETCIADEGDIEEMQEDAKLEESTTDYNESIEKYVQYKAENKLIDSDDILRLTYTALCSEDASDYRYSSFRWIQVDEVQKLSTMQLSIIKKLAAGDHCSVVYWGDERQSITLRACRQQDCIADLMTDSDVSVFKLTDNSNSSMCIQDMLVDYTINQLGVDQALLPMSVTLSQPDGSLVIVQSNNKEQYNNAVSAISRNLLYQAQELSEKTGCSMESTCVLTESDEDAEELSELLEMHNINHIKLSRRDTFHSVNYKTIYSHFAVVADEARYSDWVRILFQTKVLTTKDLARRFVKKTMEIGLSILDLMDYDGGSYFINLCESFRTREIVVYDIMTTGSDIYKDDITRIRAVKMRNGILVSGTELDISIDDKQDSGNYSCTPQKAFESFVEYVGSDELLSHNASSSILMLSNNIKRRTSGIKFVIPVYWDTLRMSRMLNLGSLKYSVEGLSEMYRLADHCFTKMHELVGIQKSFISHPEVIKIQNRLRKNYMPLYKHSSEKLYCTDADVEHTFDYEFNHVYNELLKNKYIGTIRTFSRLRNLVRDLIHETPSELSLYHHLHNHLYEVRMLNDGDMYQNKALGDNLYIMTIAKARGMEFDNVVISNSFSMQRFEISDDDALSMYIAMSRARKRLYVTCYRNIPQLISMHFDVRSYFKLMSKEKLNILLRLEEIGKKTKNTNINK